MNLQYARFTSVTFALLMAVGCASIGGYPERPEKVKDKLASLQSKYYLPAVDVVATNSLIETESEKRSYRNKVVHGRMLALDVQYAIFKEAIYKEGITSNLSLDIIGVGVGTAGAVTTGADASRILSALSGGISGARTSINKNLYYERTMPALMALMDAERTDIRSQIIKGLTQETSKYSLGQALIDLEHYLYAGSIPGAISSVTSVAGGKKNEANNKIRIVRELSYVDLNKQKLVDSLLDSVNSLPAGAAWNILKNPPSNIDKKALELVKMRLSGTDLSNASNLLNGKEKDDKAKSILKTILVMMADRSPENLAKWNATIKAHQ